MEYLHDPTLTPTRGIRCRCRIADVVPSAWAADKLASADASMLKDIAETNMAEIETGKIALEKAPNGGIKESAQMMVDDHS